MKVHVVLFVLGELATGRVLTIRSTKKFFADIINIGRETVAAEGGDIVG